MPESETGRKSACMALLLQGTERLAPSHGHHDVLPELVSHQYSSSNLKILGRNTHNSSKICLNVSSNCKSPIMLLHFIFPQKPQQTFKFYFNQYTSECLLYNLKKKIKIALKINSPEGNTQTHRMRDRMTHRFTDRHWMLLIQMNKSCIWKSSHFIIGIIYRQFIGNKNNLPIKCQ